MMNSRNHTHVTLVTEDARNARMLAGYLKRRAFAVNVLVIGRHEPHRFSVVVRGSGEVLLLDMGWFDPLRHELYQALTWVVSVWQAPGLLLVDGSWPETWVSRFGDCRVLRKPFPMETFGDQVAALAVAANAGPTVVHARATRKGE